MHRAPKWDRRAYRAASDYQKRPLIYYLWRRLRWTLGDRSPYFAYIKLTRRCNLDCSYCPWHTETVNSDDELSTDEWKLLLDQLADRGVEIFILEGGEPTLRGDLPDLVEYIRSLGLVSIVGSNGTTNPWRLRPTAFTISLDGPRRVHDSIRGEGSFDRIVENLRCNPGIPVATITVVNKENLGHLEEMLLQITPYVNSSGFTFQYPYASRAEQALSKNDIIRASSTILALKHTRRFRILNPTTTLKQLEWVCHPEIALSITHQGVVSRGCFVASVEEPQCDRCQLACYRLLSCLHRFDLEAWFNLNRHFLRHM